jgi:hypothetical protein
MRISRIFYLIRWTVGSIVSCPQRRRGIWSENYTHLSSSLAGLVLSRMSAPNARVPIYREPWDHLPTCTAWHGSPRWTPSGSRFAHSVSQNSKHWPPGQPDSLLSRQDAGTLATARDTEVTQVNARTPCNPEAALAVPRSASGRAVGGSNESQGLVKVT